MCIRDRHATKGHIQTFNPIYDYDSPFFTLPINMERDDFGISTVYRLSLTQNHPGNQNLLLLIHFQRSCVRHIYLIQSTSASCVHKFAFASQRCLDFQFQTLF